MSDLGFQYEKKKEKETLLASVNEKFINEK